MGQCCEAITLALGIGKSVCLLEAAQSTDGCCVIQYDAMIEAVSVAIVTGLFFVVVLARFSDQPVLRILSAFDHRAILSFE